MDPSKSSFASGDSSEEKGMQEHLERDVTSSSAAISDISIATCQRGICTSHSCSCQPSLSIAVAEISYDKVQTVEVTHSCSSASNAGACHSISPETLQTTSPDAETAMESCTSTAEERIQSDSSNVLSSDENISLNVNEPVDIIIVFNKKKYDIPFNIHSTILELKRRIETLTGVPVATQKVMYKGSTQDGQTLKDLNVTKGAKFMVVGSMLNDLLKVAVPDRKQATDEVATEEAFSKEPFCKQTVHKKVLEKYGKPDDVMVGTRNSKQPLPSAPVSGMYNKYGSKARLTFKLDQDEVWIGTKERTQKVKLGSIKAVVSEPIEGHEEYHIMGIQLGPTENSRYWIYWVPAQYVDAIKDTILGKWEMF